MLSRTSGDEIWEYRIALSCCEAKLGEAEISMRRDSPALTWAEKWRLDFLSTGGGSLIAAFSPAICAMLGRHTSRLCIYSRFLLPLENTALLLPTYSHGKQSSQPRLQISCFIGFFSMLACFFFLLVFFDFPFLGLVLHFIKHGFACTLRQQAGKFKLNSSGWGRHTTHHQIRFSGTHTFKFYKSLSFFLQSSTHMLPHTISPESSKVLQNFLNVMATANLHIPQAFVITACL